MMQQKILKQLTDLQQKPDKVGSDKSKSPITSHSKASMLARGYELASINSGEVGEVYTEKSVGSPGKSNEKVKATMPNKVDKNKESRIKDFNFK